MIVKAKIVPRLAASAGTHTRPHLGVLQHLLLESFDFLIEPLDQIHLLGRHERQAVMAPEQLRPLLHAELPQGAQPTACPVCRSAMFWRLRTIPCVAGPAGSAAQQVPHRPVRLGVDITGR